MKPKRKYAIGYDCMGEKLYVGSRVNFQADDGDCPHIEPFSINEDGTLVRIKRKVWFISDNGKVKINYYELPDLDNFTLIKE